MASAESPDQQDFSFLVPHHTVSHKAFYQTFYQAEQLFRRADDALTFPPLASETVVVPEAVVPSVPQPVAVLTPPRIVDPVIPAPQPVMPQAEPLRTEPVPDVPVAPPIVARPVAEDVITSEPIEPVVEARRPSVAPSPPITAADSVGERVARRPAAPMLSQKVLILVDEELLPSDLLFLEKILKAVNLDIAGVDLLNIHGTKTINFGEVLAGKYIHHFFTFGVPFTRLDLDILMDRYQPVRFDGITFLMADTLPVIEADVVLKKKLWEALKKIFLWR